MESRTGVLAVMALAGVAICGLCSPSVGFLLPQQPGSMMPARQSAATGAASSEEFGYASAGLTHAACAIMAVAGIAGLARRRSTVARKGLYRPIDLQEEFFPQFLVDPATPQPGSEEALKTMIGADVEMGDEPWDPAGFSKLYDRNFEFNNIMTYPHVQWLQEAEIKHGRICMLAFVGIIVQQFIQIPGYPQQPDWIKALDEVYDSKIGQIGITQISAFCMIVDCAFFPEGMWIGQGDREPGDLGFDPLKLTKKPGFDLDRMRLAEIKNGRLAMIGVASLAANHVIPGSVPFLTGLYAEAPRVQQGHAASFCGSARPKALRPTPVESKTAARYTTQVILPALTWVKTGLRSGDVEPGQLKAKQLEGNDVLVGKSEGGKLFCVGNLCPHIGTPLSEGADVIGDVIVCPLHGSSFNVFSGELIDWCPSPPIIGPVTGFFIDKKPLILIELRESFFGGEIEVLIDVNAKQAYEAFYWKGLLDAQGKADGSYY